ncbi:hypothetical protein ACXX82_00610 [Glaciimonas sp. GNP009]
MQFPTKVTLDKKNANIAAIDEISAGKEIPIVIGRSNSSTVSLSRTAEL